MPQKITTEEIHPPFGNYAHGMSLPAASQLLITSGQLAISKDGAIPESVAEQAALCFHNIEAILRAANLTAQNVVQLRAYVTDRAFFKDYMQQRDIWLGGREVASTLMIVSGFTLEAFKVEVEAVAVG